MEIERQAEVNVAYARPDDQVFVFRVGHCTARDDRAKAREPWSPFYNAWFPQGVDDPNLRLIRVNVTGVEFWDSSSSAMVHVIGFAKAVVTGQRYEPVENASLRMQEDKMRAGGWGLEAGWRLEARGCRPVGGWRLKARSGSWLCAPGVTA